MSVTLPPDPHQPPCIPTTTNGDLVQSDWVHDQISLEQLNHQVDFPTFDSPRKSLDAASDRGADRDSHSPISSLRPADIKIHSPRIGRGRSITATPKSPSRPVFHARAEPRQPESSPVGEPSLTELVGSPLLPKSNTTATVENRPSYSKKPPASHSSHGVGTADGPPPSFSTQRTLSQDRSWKPTLPEALNLEIRLPSPSRLSPHRSPNDQTRNEPSITDETKEQSKGIEPVMDLQGGESDLMYTPEEEKDQTLKVPDGTMTDEERKGSSSSSREDLFLHIAKVEEEKAAQTRAERRRSRIGTSYLTRAARDDYSAIDDFSSPAFNNDGLRPVTQPQHNYGTPRLSSNQFSSTASAHPLDSGSRTRYLNGSQTASFSGARSTAGRDSVPPSPDSPYGFRRRYSNAEPAGLSTRQSTVSGHRSSRLVSASAAQRPSSRSGGMEVVRMEGTESTISTTAPSTVWDELDDLKSRIRKLELTGRIPKSSAAAISSVNNERPQTATTTVTTVSSSPKHGRKNGNTPTESTIEGVPATVHPLLHEALAKARSAVNKDLYQKLEATASDALQLASMLGGGGNFSSNASAVGGGSSSERQVRRRVDSMCRGLTELSIALVDDSRKSTTAVGRPASRDTSSPAMVDSSLRYRRASQDPEEREQPTPRVQSRLDSRRSSLLHGTSQLNSPRYASPEAAPNGGTPQSQQPERNIQSRLNRHSLTLRHRRPVQEGITDETEDQPRPVSRAMTEVGNSGTRYSPRDRSSFAREYTSQHPLPPPSSRDFDSSPRSPSVVSSSIPSRRNNYNNSSALASSPLTQTDYSPSINHTPTPINTTNSNTAPSGLRRYGTTRLPTPGSSHSTTTTALPEVPQDYTPRGLPRSDSQSTVNGRSPSIRQRLSAAASSRLGIGSGSSSVGNRLTRAAAAAAAGSNRVSPEREGGASIANSSLKRNSTSQRISTTSTSMTRGDREGGSGEETGLAL